LKLTNFITNFIYVNLFLMLHCYRCTNFFLCFWFWISCNYISFQFPPCAFLLSWLYLKQKLYLYSLCTFKYVFLHYNNGLKAARVHNVLHQWVAWFWLVKLASMCCCDRIHSSDYWINKMEPEQSGNIRLQ